MDDELSWNGGSMKLGDEYCSELCVLSRNQKKIPISRQMATNEGTEARKRFGVPIAKNVEAGGAFK